MSSEAGLEALARAVEEQGLPSLNIRRHSDAVGILLAGRHRVRFEALSGSIEEFDFKKRRHRWDSGGHPDELLVEIEPGRFVLMHIPMDGPERIHIEIEPSDAAWWLKTDLEPEAGGWVMPTPTGRVNAWRRGENLTKAGPEATTRPGPAERAAGRAPAAKLAAAKDRRAGVKAILEALAEHGLWGVEPQELAQRSGIPHQTLYRYLKHPEVRSSWERYQQQSQGKPPANLDELGDRGGFSLLD